MTSQPTRLSGQRAAARDAARARQNVPVKGMRCPLCGGQVLLMTRKADGRRFLACRAFYGAEHCEWTSSEVPEDVLAVEAGATPLPGFER